MATQFVRKITGTKIKGDKKEPLHTNTQNDLLSDDEDVAIRNGDDYFVLTDSIQEITSENSSLEITKTGKNSIKLKVSEVPSIDGLATKAELNSEIATLSATIDGLEERIEALETE